MKQRPLSAQQRALLVGHFLRRFFVSEQGPRPIETQVTLIQVLGLVASPGIVIMYQLFKKYALMPPQSVSAAHLASLNERCLFLYFSMVVIGFVAVLEWNSMFPDRRDYLILGPMPIKEGTLFVAKAASLCILLLLFSVFANAVPAVLYPLFASSGSVRFIISHSLSIFAANAFVFFACISVQGLLLNIFSRRLFESVSRLVQLILLISLLSVFFIMPTVSFNELRKNTHLLNAFAPAWFLGLYETLLVGSTPEFVPLARRALEALAVAGVGFSLSYVLAYKRQLRRTLEATPTTFLTKHPNQLFGLFQTVFLKRSRERAIFLFVAKTLARSEMHRTYLGAYFGTGLAFVVMGVVSVLYRHGTAGFRVVSWELLSIPLVMSFFVLLGVRVVFSLPSSLPANWLFRLADGNSVSECLSGAWKAMLFLGTAPVLILLLPCYASWWGWRTALLHTSYCLVLAMLLMDILMIRLDKIPFTCANSPGKANLKVWWPAYLLGFSNYAYTMTALEQQLFRKPLMFIFFLAVAVVLLSLTAFYRHHRVAKLSGLRYEAEVPEFLVLLDLNRKPF